MSIGELCNREVVIVEQGESLREAVQLMRSEHVGDVVVVDVRDHQRIPVGILTDRDILIEVVAKDLDLDSVNIGDVMSRELVTAGEDTELLAAIDTMRAQGVRRLPVVNSEGGLEGLITLDDILEVFALHLGELAELVGRQQQREQQTRR